MSTYWWAAGPDAARDSDLGVLWFQTVWLKDCQIQTHHLLGRYLLLMNTDKIRECSFYYSFIFLFNVFIWRPQNTFHVYSHNYPKNIIDKHLLVTLAGDRKRNLSLGRDGEVMGQKRGNFPAHGLGHTCTYSKYF